MNIFIVFNTFQTISENQYICFEFLLLSSIVLLGSGAGIIFFHKNLILVFMCFELFFVGVAINFIVCAMCYYGTMGLIFGYLSLLVIGAESALSLAILTAYFFLEQHIIVDLMGRLKG